MTVDLDFWGTLFFIVVCSEAPRQLPLPQPHIKILVSSLAPPSLWTERY